MGRTFSLLAPIVAGAVLVVARASLADDRPTMTLDYVVAEGVTGCPTKEQVHQRLAEEIGYDPVVVAGPKLEVSLEVTPSPDGFRGRYASRTSSGETSQRELTSDSSCDDLVASFVLAAAISLDPEVEPRASPPPTPEPKVVSVPVPVYIDRPVVVPKEAPHPPSIRVTFHAGYGVGGGIVPGLAHGPSAFVGLRGAAFEVGLEGTYLFEGKATSSVGDVLVSSAFASILPCWAPSLADRLRFYGCAHVAIGGGFVDADRVDAASPTTVPIALLGGRAGLGLHLTGPLEARLFGDLLAHLTPIDASIADHGKDTLVFESSPVAGRGLLTLALTVP